MKIKALMIAGLICLFSVCMTACNANNNQNIISQDNIQKINITYMKDLAIDVDNSTAYGIKKSSNGISNISNTSNSGTTLLRASLTSSEEVLEKNTLFTTTETYENGNVEYSANSIKQVTFKKKTTIQENVYDSNGNLIDENTTITQDEIPAQINRLYVNGKFMFMQFVALVNNSGYYNYIDADGVKSEYIALRPEELTYDENGISEFDITNYYSSALSQSFVVDLLNGNIYKITNLNIARIHDIDIVQDNDNNFYKMTINNNNELVFTDVMPNKNVSPTSVRTDKYGYTFVLNYNAISGIDYENKIVYVSSWNYMISDDGTVYTIVRNGQSEMDPFIIDKQFVDGELQDINSNETILGLKMLQSNLSTRNPVMVYKGQHLYDYCGSGLGLNDLIGNTITIPDGYFKMYPKWFVGEHYYLYFIYDDSIYYMRVDLDTYIEEIRAYTLDSFGIVADKKLYQTEYYLNVANNRIKISNAFYETQLNGTKYYQLYETDGRLELRLLQDKQYTQNVFIFQPINK